MANAVLHEGLTRKLEQNAGKVRFRRWKNMSVSARVACILLLFVVLVAVVAVFWTPCDPYVDGMLNQPPSADHPFGTDNKGRDVLSRMMVGARTSLVIGLGATAFALVVGSIIGSIAAVSRKWISEVIMRIMDGMLSFPFILLAIILMTVLGSGLFNVILAIGIGSVPNFARVLRGEVIIVKNAEYCNAARVLGVSNACMLFTHILPNAISPLIVYATLGIAGAIISEAALSFLGLGITEPTPSWGQILYSGKDVMSNHPIISTVSGIFILVTVLGFNLLGDGIRDVMDPKMKK